MKWVPRTASSILPASVRMRLETEAWLNAALASNEPFPRIPLRRVDRGGFDSLRKSPRGEATAARWWRAALNKTPLTFR